MGWAVRFGQVDVPYDAAAGRTDGLVPDLAPEAVAAAQNAPAVAWRQRALAGRTSLWRPRRVHRIAVKKALKHLDNVVRVLSPHKGLVRWRRVDTADWADWRRWRRSRCRCRCSSV